MVSNLYSKIIVIGSGQLAFRCACLCRQYISDVVVLERKVTESTTLQIQCEKEQISYSDMCSDEITAYLLGQSKRTLVVSAANTYIFPAKVIERENLVILNWHNALLPRHKGRNAEVWTIFCGDSVTGVTWHYIAEDVDAGEIIAQRTIKIDDEITAMKLYKAQIECGVEMFAEFLGDMLDGKCVSIPQPESKENEMHYAKHVPNEGVLDLKWEFSKISRFLRSMDYGSLLLMGKMKVSYCGKQYSFYKYKIKETNEYFPVRSIKQVDDSLELMEGNKQIILRNLQEI